jgi:UDP-N-acetylmuramate dehydrogenase
MNRRQKDEFQKLVEGNIFFDEPMSKYTSFGIGGKADAIISPGDVEELIRAVVYLQKERIPYFILGKGTNILVKDGGIRGAVISLIKYFRKIKEVEEEKDYVLIDAQAGVSLAELIRFCIQKGLSGLEFASGIPGSLGGALIMNAGSFGGELGEVVERVVMLNGRGKTGEKKKGELSFSYRRLHLPRETIILSAILKLKKASKEKVAAQVEALFEKRKLKQPLKFKSGGSIFKNPQGDFAGKLIEEAGLKGLQIENTMVSDLHANFIVNLGEARAKDIISLIEKVQREVYQRKGIKLEPEIVIAGEE